MGLSTASLLDVAGNGTATREYVAEYYNAKTSALLEKYGPGPRVHYHIGYFYGHPEPLKSAHAMRRRLVAAQELMLEHAAHVWDADRCLSGALLDVGAGLGGGSIFWAQRFNADVTAVTNARDHVVLIQHFARWAGVGEQIKTLYSDACAVPTTRTYDAAVAIESSCHLPREEWFRHLARLIRPGGYVCVEDVFVVHPDGASVWDAYFRAKSGSVAEYVRAAAKAGFEVDVNVNTTQFTHEFWLQSIAWIDAVLADEELDESERARLQHSHAMHRRVFEQWCEGELEVRQLRFVRSR